MSDPLLDYIDPWTEGTGTPEDPYPIEYHYSKLHGQTFRADFDLGELVPGDRLALSWDMSNPHGERYRDTELACAVAVNLGGRHLGFLPSPEGSYSTARSVIDHWMQEGDVRCTITGVTGGAASKPTRGLNLELLFF